MIGSQRMRSINQYKLNNGRWERIAFVGNLWYNLLLASHTLEKSPNYQQKIHGADDGRGVKTSSAGAKTCESFYG